MQHRHLAKQTPLSLAAKSLLAFGLLALALFGSFSTAAAQTPIGFEGIVDYDVEITINDDNSMHVVETIEYEFSSFRHGILRDIPTAAIWFDDPDLKLVWPLDNVSVFSAEAPDQFATEHPNEFTTRLRIGDPDQTITGTYTYVITYDQAGIVNAQPGGVDGEQAHDQFYWNVVGQYWNVPILDATITIGFPAEVGSVDCFAGPFGQEFACDSVTSNRSTVQIRHQGLSSFAGITVVAAMPAGTVSNTEPMLEKRRNFTNLMALDTPHFAAAGVFFALIAGAIGLVFWRVGRDRRASGTFTDAAFADGETTERVPVGELKNDPVQFAPPDGISPAHFYLLLKEQVPTRIVTTTIVDLAVRGHLTIEEVDDGDDYQLELLESKDELLDFEEYLIKKLFGSDTTVLISDLKYDFADSSKRMRSMIYSDAKKKHWFLGRPDHVRSAWAVGGFFIFIAGIGLTALAAYFIGHGVLFVPIAAAGIIIAGGARWMPAKTPKGSGMAGRARGFAYFLEQSEAYRSQLAEEAHLFTEYLPYVMAIGATDKWTKTFEGIHVETPDWYVGNHVFVPYYFGRQMDSFSTSTASTLTAVQPSSSGSSGFSGGFSGGGGGGGGGGSW